MMGRRMLVEPETTARLDPVQSGLFDASALNRVKAEGLDRLTWRDHVDFGDVQTPASRLPAWKLGWRKGWRVTLTPRTADSPPVYAVVLEDVICPTNFGLPVLIMCGIELNGQRVAEEMIPATAVLRCGG